MCIPPFTYYKWAPSICLRIDEYCYSSVGMKMRVWWYFIQFSFLKPKFLKSFNVLFSLLFYRVTVRIARETAEDQQIKIEVITVSSTTKRYAKQLTLQVIPKERLDKERASQEPPFYCIEKCVEGVKQTKQKGSLSYTNNSNYLPPPPPQL